jgi:hypothetical protein
MNSPSIITTTSPSATSLLGCRNSPDKAALTALRYEQNHKDRAGAVTAIENRLAARVEQDISRN